MKVHNAAGIAGHPCEIRRDESGLFLLYVVDRLTLEKTLVAEGPKPHRLSDWALWQHDASEVRHEYALRGFELELEHR